MTRFARPELALLGRLRALNRVVWARLLLLAIVAVCLGWTGGVALAILVQKGLTS